MNAGKPMGEMTGKQKRFLRSRGQPLRPAVLLGKAGLSPGTTQAIRDALQSAELVKVRLPGRLGGARRQWVESLARDVGAECVGLVGRSALLYAPNPQLPPHQRIELP